MRTRPKAGSSAMPSVRRWLWTSRLDDSAVTESDAVMEPGISLVHRSAKIWSRRGGPAVVWKRLASDGSALWWGGADTPGPPKSWVPAGKRPSWWPFRRCGRVTAWPWNIASTVVRYERRSAPRATHSITTTRNISSGSAGTVGRGGRVPAGASFRRPTDFRPALGIAECPRYQVGDAPAGRDL